MRVSQDGEQWAWESWHELCPQVTAPVILQEILRHHTLKEGGAVFSLLKEEQPEENTLRCLAVGRAPGKLYG